MLKAVHQPRKVCRPKDDMRLVDMRGGSTICKAPARVGMLIIWQSRRHHHFHLVLNICVHVILDVIDCGCH